LNELPLRHESDAYIKMEDERTNTASLLLPEVGTTVTAAGRTRLTFTTELQSFTEKGIDKKGDELIGAAG
jgi:hypothetical protein